MIPVYVKFFGLELYGIISLFATLNLFLQVLDFGIYPTLIKETSQRYQKTTQYKLEKYIKCFLIINLIIALLIILISIFSSNYLAEEWFNKSNISKSTISNCLMLIGFQIACRWPILIFQGILFGSPIARYGFILNILIITINALGSLILLYIFKIGIESFLIWQIISGLFYTLIIYLTCKFKLAIILKSKIKIRDFKSSFNVSSQLWLVTASAILFSQIDKILLSNLVSLDNYGLYMLAVSAAGILQIVINPFYTIFFPKFSKMFIQKQFNHIHNLYNLLLKLMAAFIFPLGLFLVISSDIFIYLWTRDENLAFLIAPIFNLLLISSIINGINYVPYILQLSYGKNWIPILLNIMSTILMFPFLYIFVSFYGVLGGGALLMMFQFVIMIINPIIIKKFVENDLLIKNYFFNIFFPFTNFVLGIVFYYFFIRHFDLNFYIILLSLGFFFFNILTNVFFDNELRKFLINFNLRQLK